jgi:hypothetical protein
VSSRSAILSLVLLALAASCSRSPETATPEPPRRETVRVETLSRPNISATVVQTAEVAVPAPAADSSDPGVSRGLSYRNERVRDVPWSINLLKIDRSRSDFELTTTLGDGSSIGLVPLSEQIAALPPELGQPLAAINGDFYRIEQESYAGDPRGLQIMRGELVRGPGKVSFWVDADGNPSIGTVTSRFVVTWPNGETAAFGLNEERHSNDAILYTSRMGPSTRTTGGRELVLIPHGDSTWLPLRVGQKYAAEVQQVREGGNSRLNSETMVLSIGTLLVSRVPSLRTGDVIQLSTATSPDLTGSKLALGGGPVLVHEGKVQPAYANKSREKHPRSAFGWNDKEYFFVEVDGRQGGFSIGMTLPELASYLVRQGCQEAMNLDGGGSAEMWIEGEVVNRPCFGVERRIGNGLVLVRKRAVAGK